ncbi:DUF6578 domain-containing protein [Curtobacterium sp. VKM Ac-2887]|uniref:DUF6578 domain-containing protein n=1 Tax=Curtobacterium sp. VKM Ac-2887 TaxID=2783819 RepID=UPI00188DB7B5|nr:DUF6578 domain-containing protein [Curtobacterium sp. VKM Ac-2887]MBF4587970.1 hypothetical protein [Curtobacterium sp. VKM Ac-2887]
MKIWIPRWYLEDLSLDLKDGDSVDWIIIPAHREWYTDMLGDDAPSWEIDSIASDSPNARPIAGAIKEIYAIAPDFEQDKAPSAADRWPTGAKTQKVENTFKVHQLDISIHVTGFVVNVESSP